MKTTVINPHGFCAGVKNAIKTALGASSRGGVLYCLHELVHNETVVEDLRRRGAVFVESIDDIPPGGTVLFSAHGVAPRVFEKARARGLEIIDATCPFVKRVHISARSFAARGMRVVIIGRRNHAEVEGILGEAPGAAVIGDAEEAERVQPGGAPDAPVGVVSQTTMNGDEVAAVKKILSRRFKIESDAEICSATKERQDAVKAFEGDALLVLGSANSSNTKRLCETSRCARTMRAANMDEVRSLDLSGIRHLGVTSGASTPEEILLEAVEYIRSRYETAK